MAESVDISHLPPPPRRTGTEEGSQVDSINAVDISGLPPPPSNLSGPDISDLPPPPAPPEQKIPEFLKPEDFQNIAAKHGVSPDDLRQLAPYYGVTAETEPGIGPATSEAAKYTAGFAGRSYGLGIPQYLYKKTQSKPMREALDELNEIGQKQRPGLETASEFVAPGGAIGQASKRAAVRLIGSAATGGLVGAANSREGEELSGATTGAAVGLGLGAVGEGLAHRGTNSATRAMEEHVPTEIQEGASKLAKETQNSEDIIQHSVFNPDLERTPEASKAIVEEQFPSGILEEFDRDTVPGKALRAKVGNTEPAVLNELADDIVDKRVTEFVSHITGENPKNSEEAYAALDTFRKRQGEEATEKLYDQFRKRTAEQKYINLERPTAFEEPGLVGKTVNKLSAAQWVGKHIDDLYDVGAERAMAEVAANANKMTHLRVDTRKDLQGLYDLAKNNGTLDKIWDSPILVKAVEDPALMAKLSPAEQETSKAIQHSFDKSLNIANESRDGVPGMSIPKRENYIPRIPVTTAEQKIRVDSKIREALQDSTEILGRPVQNLRQLSSRDMDRVVESPAMQELLEFNRWKTNSAQTPDSGRTLAAELHERFLPPEGGDKLTSQARASIERVEDAKVPDFIREYNVFKLKDAWDHNTFKHVFARLPLDRLRTIADNLDKIGAKQYAKYIRNYAADQLGYRPNTLVHWLSSGGRSWKDRVNEFERNHPNVPKATLDVVRAIPDLTRRAMSNLYPAIMGGRLKPIIENMLTLYTNVAPSIGGPYGYSVVTRGLLNARASLPKYMELARRIGASPAEHIRQAEAALAEGITRSKAFNNAAGINQKIANGLMWGMQKTDEAMRAISLSVGETMARDIAKNHRPAMRMLSGMSRDIQRDILSNPQDVQRNAEILGRNLASTSLYNYGRTQMSELGREAGPLLSTFSTWPTNVLGELAYNYRKNGVGAGSLRNFSRWGIPYAALAAANAVLGMPFKESNFLVQDDTALSDRWRKTLGPGGFTGMAPITTLESFGTGKIATPPAIDLMVKASTAAVKRDPEKFKQVLDQALLYYVPPSGLIRTLTDDLPTYVTGERPGGSTNIDRTIDTLKKVTK